MAAAPQKVLNRGRVKQVLSGDTIIIVGAPRGGPPPERTLSLAGVTAPRLARRPFKEDEEETQDEPWAWLSREALRKKLVGRDITFTVDYQVPSGREFGTVFLGSENVVKTMVAEGAVKLREGARNEGEEWEEMVRLGAAAEASKLGVHQDASSNKAVRRITWNVENPRALVDSAKGKPVDAVVEQVRDGSTLRVFLLPTFKYITVMLTGVKTPMLRKADKGEIPEPFAAEARYYTETRLLQRDVQVVLEGFNGQNFLGTVLHPNGNISELILRDGFARIADWSLGNVSDENRVKYRAAENYAKEKKLRLFANYAPAAQIPAKEKNFQAVVEEIINPECIVVRLPNNTTRKLWLSSVRQPPRSGAESSARTAMYETPWAFEAREFLRKKLVGQKVKVEIDYIRPAQDNYPEKPSATIMFSSANIAEALIGRGLATCLRHKQDDDQRSMHFDELMAAEARAIKNKKGLHSEKEAPLHRVNDLTGRENKSIADRMLPSLQRAGRVSAVVEFVSSGSRFRVFVPKETCLISMVLAGISCPRSGGPNGGGEPFGDEAMDCARQAVLQREAQIEIEGIDKSGNFVGHVYVDHDNLAVTLLQKGLASVHSSADRYKNYGPVLAAETQAKNSKLGLWANYVEKQEVAAPVEQTERRTDYKEVLVTDVSGPLTFYVQLAANVDKVEQLVASLNSKASSFTPGAIQPKKNALVAAKFSADNRWYRARVESISGADYTVLFVDYGNKETVGLKSIAALPPGFDTEPALARRLTLAYVTFPLEDYASDIEDFLRDVILGKLLLCNVEYKDADNEYATLLDKASKADAATVLLAAGYAIVQPRREKYLQSLVAEYKKAQMVAKEAHVGMWVYGDITPDDDSEFGMRN